MQPAMFAMAQQQAGALYAPQQLLLNQGDRVEVKWEIQDDETEETYVKARAGGGGGASWGNRASGGAQRRSLLARPRSGGAPP